jgi:hypothetical protein
MSTVLQNTCELTANVGREAGARGQPGALPLGLLLLCAKRLTWLM